MKFLSNLVRIFLLILTHNHLCLGTWGNDGEIATDIQEDDVARAAVFQGDGRIVVAGRVIQTNFNMFAVARYWPDGTLDSTFSGDGIVTTRLQINLPIENSYAWAHDVILDSSDRIIAVGRAWTGSFGVGGDGYNFAVVRYLTDGTLDTAFDSDGIVDIDMGARKADFARNVAIQSDGDIVVGGFAMNSAGNYDFGWARLLENGTLDTTLDADGIRTLAIGTANDVSLGMILSSNSEKVVLSGYIDNAGTDNIAIAVFNNDGTMHTAFSSDGVATSAPGSNHSRAYDISEDVGQNQYNVVGRSNNGSNHDAQRVRWNDADGSIDFSHTFVVGTAADIIHSTHIEDTDTENIVVGRTHNGTNWDFLVARVDHDSAALSASFDTSTNYTYAIGGGNDDAYDVAYANRKIVAVGRTYRTTEFNFALLRFNSDGSIATAGDVDHNFSSDGFSKIRYGNPTRWTGVAMTSDGQIVVAGWSEIGGTGTDDRDFIVSRINEDGSLDNAFGTGGGATSVGFTASQRDECEGMAIDTQGRIILAGHGEVSNADSRNLAIVRYLPSGDIDSTFSSDGLVFEQFPSNDQTEIEGVLIGTDNRIIAFGWRETAGGDPHDFSVAMYLEDGANDTGFSADGFATVDSSDVGNRDNGLGAVLASDGAIVVGGYGRIDADNNAIYDDWTLAKFDHDGAIDSTFSNDGRITVQLSSHQDRIEGLALQTDGKIVAAGWVSDTANSDADWAVGRFLADGAFDSTFSNDGWLANDVSGDLDKVFGVVVQPNGKIVAAGEANNDWLIVRITPDGEQDTTWDNDGVRTITDVGTDELYGLALKTDGRYVAVGRTGSTGAAIVLWP